MFARPPSNAGPTSTKRALLAALNRYAASKPYLQALARKGAWRHDIDGAPVAKVAEAERARALARLGAHRGGA